MVQALVQRVACGGGERRHVLGERLVQPQVVPPAHGHQVAEPHVRQLVQDRHGAALDRGLGDLGPEHVGLEERHRAGVLHGAGVELRHEQLVVLGERVRDAERALVEVEAGARDVDDVVGVQVLGQRAAAVDAERDGAAVLAGELAVLRVVRPGDDRGDVRRDARRGLERPRRGALVDAAVAVGAALDDDGHADLRVVGHDGPVRRRGHGERERRLEVGLLEHGEHAPGVGHLELRVQVDLVVHGVDEAVQALAGVHVRGVGDDDELVARGEVVQRMRESATTAATSSDRPLSVTSCTVGAIRSMNVRAPGVAANRTTVRERERRRTGREVEGDVVRLGGDDCGALARLGTGEVLSRHAGTPRDAIGWALGRVDHRTQRWAVLRSTRARVDATYDAVIVGGGHNGLTAAAYLARAGRTVLLLERADHLGGATRSARAFPGVDANVSRYSYLVSLMPRQVRDELGLRRRAAPPPDLLLHAGPDDARAARRHGRRRRDRRLVRRPSARPATSPPGGRSARAPARSPHGSSRR